MTTPRRLELLHWNDVHGRYDALARMSARARAIRESADHPVLLLDGGDVEETSVRLSALTYGVAGWRMLGAAGVDAAVVGNGGLLRYGPGVLPRYAAALGSPPLVCDLERDGETPAGAAPSRILERGGLRVGVIGTTDYYPQYDDLGLTERGRVTAVRREATTLRARGRRRRRAAQPRRAQPRPRPQLVDAGAGRRDRRRPHPPPAAHRRPRRGAAHRPGRLERRAPRTDHDRDRRGRRPRRRHERRGRARGRGRGPGGARRARRLRAGPRGLARRAGRPAGRARTASPSPRTRPRCCSWRRCWTRPRPTSAC